MTPEELVNKKYTFEDGNSIEVTQVKYRNSELALITYQIIQGPGIPRRLVMEYHEFLDTYGHLFVPGN